MATYKQEVTLNEKDSLQDLLNLEKTMVKVYSTAMTEGASKGFRNMIKNIWIDTTTDQLNVFLLMTEMGYCRVESAPESILNAEREKFLKVQGQLS